jgi:hypothetical protein
MRQLAAVGGSRPGWRKAGGDRDGGRAGRRPGRRLGQRLDVSGRQHRRRERKRGWGGDKGIFFLNIKEILLASKYRYIIA